MRAHAIAAEAAARYNPVAGNQYWDRVASHRLADCSCCARAAKAAGEVAVGHHSSKRYAGSHAKRCQVERADMAQINGHCEASDLAREIISYVTL
jgi:hypothetical protein